MSDIRKPFYITTTLPYVNADPHVGFALEIIKADVVARLHTLQGDDVFFNTGTDEHGQKLWQAAVKQGVEPQVYIDEYAAKFRALKEKLDLLPGLHFIRTTDSHHTSAAQEFWRICAKNDDIYKKVYQIKYCVGCELEKTDSELIDGRCPLHPNAEIELIDEENYFFRFSKYQQPLLALYAAHPDFILPDFRQNEMKLFIERGLQDFSISRLKSKMPWGIDVPDDSDQVMYVWFDALVNYISTLGWPEDHKHFERFWGTQEQPNALQIGGKDNLRQQSAMWQAMLMSAGLPNSKQVIIQGFVTSGGQKMSKSLGNVINPFDVVDELGADALRYVLLRHTSPFEDSDITHEGIREHYTAHLTNGLGNLVARVMELAQVHLPHPVELASEDTTLSPEFTQMIDSFRFNEAMDAVFAKIGAADAHMTEHKPFAGIKSGDAVVRETARADIEHLVRELAGIAAYLAPAMPRTAAAVASAVRSNKRPENLFPRLA
ncbi:MAG: methionine--tRNA ligase [bacterium]|nr:methionine--tRNA ligase [bacterium]